MTSVGKFRRVRLAAGTSAGGMVLLSSGYLVWQAYGFKTSANRGGCARAAVEERVNDNPEYILLPEGLSDRFKLEKIDAKEELKSRIPKHLRKPWKLLRQANWGEYEAHLNAVRELAKLNLNDGEYRQIAQSSNRSTAVGLARTIGVDLRLFVPPPPCPEHIKHTATPRLFQKILSDLPRTPDVNECIRFFTSTALESYVPGCDDELIADVDLGNEFNRDSHHIVPVALRKRYSERSLIEFCLQALLSHSTVEAHCSKMIDLEVLPVFAKIVRDHPNNAMIKSLIGITFKSSKQRELVKSSKFR